MTKNEERINKLFKELVPETGKADSLAGELVRAMSRIGYRFYNDGDQLGIGYGKETCNPAGRFLGVKGNDKIAKLTADAWAVYSEEAYEKVLDILCGAVADYVEQNPDLRNQPTEDMWDFKDEEKALLEIAKRLMTAIDSRGDLEARDNDSEDFIEVPVWGIQKAMEEAYLLGRMTR